MLDYPSGVTVHGTIHQAVKRARLLLLVVAVFLCFVPTAQAMRSFTPNLAIAPSVLGGSYQRLNEEPPGLKPEVQDVVSIAYIDGRIGLFVGNNPISRFDPYGLAWYNPVDWYNGIVNAISDPIARLWTGGIDAQGNAAITTMLSAHDYDGMQDFQMQHPGFGGDITAGNTDANAAIANMASGAANLYLTAATMVTPTATGARCVTILAKNGTKITGFTGHGVERAVGGAVGRAGVKPQAILDALQNPLKITSGVDQLGRPFQIFVGQDARVVVNPQTGNVVSVNPLSGAGAH
jgi:hypothetical protein